MITPASKELSVNNMSADPKCYDERFGECRGVRSFRFCERRKWKHDHTEQPKNENVCPQVSRHVLIDPDKIPTFACTSFASKFPAGLFSFFSFFHVLIFLMFFVCVC